MPPESGSDLFQVPGHETPKVLNGGHSSRRIFSSADLFAGEREVYIRHQDNDYRLFITKAGKLILNK